MEHFIDALGAPAFSSYNDSVFTTEGITGKSFSKLDFAITHMIYRSVGNGSKDVISPQLVYGDVFRELWCLSPNQEWLFHLRMKDFRSPSVNQIWVEEVDESEYGETKSLSILKTLFIEEARKGWFGLIRHARTFGIRILDEEFLNEVNAENWRGLKEWFVDEFPSFFIAVAPTEMWKQLFSHSPQKTLERAFNLVWDAYNGWEDKLKLLLSIKHYEEIVNTIRDAALCFRDDEESKRYFAKVTRMKNLGHSSDFLTSLIAVLDRKKEPNFLQMR